MKIAIDARFWGLEHTGLGRYTMNLIKSLSNVDKKNDYFILLRGKYYDGLNFPENFTKIKADYKHYGMSEQVFLPRVIKALDVDFTHYLHFNLPLFSEKPFIVTIHDLTMHRHKGATFLPAPIYWIKKGMYKLVFRNAVMNSDRIIVPTNAVKNDLVSHYRDVGEKFVSIPEGYDEVFLRSKDNQKLRKKYGIAKNYVIYVGNTYPHKNIKRLVEAIYLVNKRGDTKVDLIIVSANDKFTKQLKSDLGDYGAQENVKFLYDISDSELADLYKTSVALVYPSLAEGFGLQGLEAMASETLVLASDIPVFKEVYKKNAIYFNPHDFASIGKAIQDAVDMSDKVKMEKIESAKKFISKYSWDRMAEKTVKVYEQVAK